METGSSGFLLGLVMSRGPVTDFDYRDEIKNGLDAYKRQADVLLTQISSNMSQAERTYIMVKVRRLAQLIVPTLQLASQRDDDVGGGGDGLEVQIDH